MDEEQQITVCDQCLRACCWKGIFMCDDAQNAGTVEKTADELAALDLEHPSYWATDPISGQEQTK